MFFFLSKMFFFEQIRELTFASLICTQPSECAMDDIIYPDFPHRIAPDGSYEAICILCLATVATAKDMHELKARHNDHVCQSVEWAKNYLPNRPC